MKARVRRAGEAARGGRWSSRRCSARDGVGRRASRPTCRSSAYAVAGRVSPVQLPPPGGGDAAGPLSACRGRRGEQRRRRVPARRLRTRGGRPVRAVVLFSDGRQVAATRRSCRAWRRRACRCSRSASRRRAAARPRVRARRVACPPRAFVGETVTVRASVIATGAARGRGRVQLNAGDVVQSQRVDIKRRRHRPADVEIRAPARPRRPAADHARRCRRCPARSPPRTTSSSGG